jgi:hypothetical protein
MYKVLVICSFLATTFFNVAVAGNSGLCPNDTGYYYTNYKSRNPQPGGFVSDGAFVEETVYIT